jgi:hypothetical protein
MLSEAVAVYRYEGLHLSTKIHSMVGTQSTRVAISTEHFMVCRIRIMRRLFVERDEVVPLLGEVRVFYHSLG